jgi:antitoxin VapB
MTPVVLVAADERIASYRHPIPRGATIERRAMLVVCAESSGLYVSLTRFVELEEPDEEIRRRQEACGEILRRMREEVTRPGRTLADAFADCKTFYAEAGFPEEWRLHHQGGMAGYAAREIVASEETVQEIYTGQAFAWNPLDNRREGRRDLYPHRERTGGHHLTHEVIGHRRSRVHR